MRVELSTAAVAPAAVLACAAASGWLPVPTALLLIVASAGLSGIWPRVGLAVAALALTVGGAFLGATLDPVSVAPETVAGLSRLVEVYGAGGAAASVSTHPVRAVAGVAEGGVWGGVVFGEAVRIAVCVAVGALASRVPPAAWRVFGTVVAVWLAALVVAMVAVRLA